MSAVLHFPVPESAPIVGLEPLVNTPTALWMAMQWGRGSLSKMVERALCSTDDTLFGMAERVQTELDRRRLFGVMRSISVRAPGLIETFEKALSGLLVRTLVAPPADGELRLKDEDQVEDEIVVSRIANRAEHAARRPLWDYVMRLQNIPEQDGLRASFERMQPLEVTRLYRQIIDSAGLDSQTRIILFKVFERQFLADAPNIYAGLVARLEEAGIAAVTTVGRPAPVPLPNEPAAPVFQVSPRVSALLGDMGLGQRIAQSETPLSPGAYQRVALVMQVLSEITADWLPDDAARMRPLVRPLLMIGLTQIAFFEDYNHPARRILRVLGRRCENRTELLEKAADFLERLQERGVKVLGTEALSPSVLSEFLRRQRNAEPDTSARMEQARAQAHDRIRVAGSGRDLPAGMARFLTQIWLPLASAVLLKYGNNSTEMEHMAQMLAYLFRESRWLPKLQNPSLSPELLTTISDQLRKMAVPDALITKAQDLLRQGLLTEEGRAQLLDVDTLAPRKARERQLLAAEDSGAAVLNEGGVWSLAVPAGAWFRLYDRMSKQSRWVSAGVIEPGSSSLVFAGFDPSITLAIDRQLLLEDLLGGRAEPVDPTEDQASAIRLLCDGLKASAVPAPEH